MALAKIDRSAVAGSAAKGIGTLLLQGIETARPPCIRIAFWCYECSLRHIIFFRGLAKA